MTCEYASVDSYTVSSQARNLNRYGPCKFIHLNPCQVRVTQNFVDIALVRALDFIFCWSCSDWSSSYNIAMSVNFECLCGSRGF